MCVFDLYIQYTCTVVLYYYSIALCKALRTYIDLRHTNAILID